MKSYITPDTKHKDALWLIVERGQQSPEIEAIMGRFRDEDTSENVAYPIRDDEVEAIMQACIDYLVKSDRKTDDGKYYCLCSYWSDPHNAYLDKSGGNWLGWFNKEEALAKEEGALEERERKSIPLSVMDIALHESLKINAYFGRRLNYSPLKKFRSVSEWLKHLKSANTFSEEAFRDFKEEVKQLYQLTNPLVKETR